MDLSDLCYDAAALVALCERYHVQRIDVFGSFARGQAEEKSDLDLLVSFRPGVVHGMSFLRFAEELEDLFGRRIDLLERHLVEQDHARPVFQRMVLHDLRTLYSHDSLAA